MVTPHADYAVAIVTGGSRGIGRALARGLASRGAAVVVVYLRDQGEADAAVEEILAANGTALAVRADVTDELDVERLFDETAAAFGGVDVIVHTAVRGTAVVYRKAARRLRPGGAIVDVSSSGAVTPFLAGELRARDITVNGLAPGAEAPGAGLVALLDRWRAQTGGVTRACPGANQGAPRDAACRRQPEEVTMSSTDVSGGTPTQIAETRPGDMKLEVVVLPVSDADRAKTFYASLGWREDADFVFGEDYRVLQFTPPGSQASIVFGVGVTAAEPGSVDGLILAVEDIDAAREELGSHRVDVSEVFHDAAGGLGGGFHAGSDGRAPGPDPQGRSYGSYASFSDPDGNGWLLQEITERLPGRVEPIDVAPLARLLLETAQHHDAFEKAAPAHDWWDWYAAYLSARRQGRSAEQADAAADAYMEEAHGVLASR